MAKLFTREEAEALLPKIEPLLQEIRELGREIAEHEAYLQVDQIKLMSNGHKPPADTETLQNEVRILNHRIHANVEAILAMEVIVKDLAEGLVDFPSLLHGREVYLCWKLGEDGIHWWHEIEAGFAGRQPLD
ncbi:MAG: DUF2203 domain-containing protein [Chloroflexi bacterium]|nr:MAG: DUF2203 domain-containing protein [Chloroflexota bacterium]